MEIWGEHCGYQCSHSLSIHHTWFLGDALDRPTFATISIILQERNIPCLVCMDNCPTPGWRGGVFYTYIVLSWGPSVNYCLSCKASHSSLAQNWAVNFFPRDSGSTHIFSHLFSCNPDRSLPLLRLSIISPCSPSLQTLFPH